MANPVFHQGSIEFGTNDKNRADDVKKDQRNHDGRQPGIGCRIIGKCGQIRRESPCSADPAQQGQSDAGQYVKDRSAPCREPQMRDNKANQKG